MSNSAPLFAGRDRESGGHWLSVSDLMAGLMMIFLFIAIIYMREVQKVIVVADETLPPPQDLVSKEDTVKVTISLSKKSVEFFKQEAKKHGTQYQKMIRKLLDFYVRQYEQNERPGY